MSVFLRDTNKKSTTSFKDQFKKKEGVENNFYPFNQFDKFKNSSEADSSRDNTLIIKDYGQNHKWRSLKKYPCELNDVDFGLKTSPTIYPLMAVPVFVRELIP